MSDPPHNPDADGAAPDDGRADAEAQAMTRLRELLVGPEKQQIHTIEQRLDNPELHARDVSRVLAEAVRLRQQSDDKLASELYPTVEKAIDRSVRRNPRAIADAIFPIIGPAIRKAIGEALTGLVESINQALEHSLSPRSIKWRLEAWRTGRSFTEVVLAHTLEYRVEQVFLIHRETGLLLLHVAADPEKSQDADMVSGMLTAIQDFVRDSFGAGDDDAVESLKMGDLTVLADSAPRVVLAAVVRGNPPAVLRRVMDEAVETVQLDHSERLGEFDGDTTPFETSRPALEACLMEARKASESGGVPWMGWAVVVLVVAALAWWAIASWTAAARWDRFISALEREPGIVVTRVDDEQVHVLRDPYARDPADIIAEHDMGDDASVLSEVFESAEPEIIVTRARAVLGAPDSVSVGYNAGVLGLNGSASVDWIRDAAQRAPTIGGVERVDMTGLVASDLAAAVLAEARRRLAPPDTIGLDFVDDGTLVAVGSAAGPWIQNARRVAPQITGVTRYDDTRVQDDDEIAAAAAARYLERAVLYFESAEDALNAEQAGAVTVIAARIRDVLAARPQARITIVGHTDELGSDESKARLSLARARHVAERLRLAGVPDAALNAVGLADSRPAVENTDEQGRARNRRVTFQLNVSPND